jgi:hypothetical protein
MLGQEIANSTHQVKKWTEEIPDAHNLNSILGSNSVKAGHNHKAMVRHLALFGLKSKTVIWELWKAAMAIPQHHI